MDLEQTIIFFKALDPEGRFTFQTFDDLQVGKNGKRIARKDPSLVKVLHGTLQDHQAELERLNKAGAGVFVTINQTDGKGRRAENIIAIRAVFLDLDGAPLPESWDLEPHLIIESSPGRFHCYWLLKPGFPRDKFEVIQKAIAVKYHGDRSINDISRVMRVPGFLHRKGEPFMSRILRDWSGEARYSEAQISEAFLSVESPPEKPSISLEKDPILKALRERGLLSGQRREKGVSQITCPWASEHTNGDPYAFVYMPHYNGYTNYGFKCFHDHCADRSISDLREFLGTSSEDESFKMYRVSDLFDQAEEEIPWIVEDLIPEGSLAALGSLPKRGKSTLARCLALSIATGSPFLGLEVIKGDVVYLALEERRDSVVSQFKTLAINGFGLSEEEARAALSHVGLICGPVPKNVIPKLRRLVETHHPVLIIVDTLIRFVRLKDSNSYSETSNALEAIMHLAHETGSAILFLHHSPKNNATELLGSTGIQATPDVILMLVKKENGRTLSAEGRNVLFEPVTLQYHPEGLYYSMGVTVEEAGIRTMIEHILDFMRKKPEGISWKDLEEQIGGRHETRNEAIKKLVEEYKIERKGKARSKTDPLKFILSPGGEPLTRGSSSQDAEIGSGTGQVLIPYQADPQRESDFLGDQDEEDSPPVAKPDVPRELQ